MGWVIRMEMAAIRMGRPPFAWRPHVRYAYNRCMSTIRPTVLLGVHLDRADAELVRQRAQKADRSVSAELRVGLRRYLADAKASASKTSKAGKIAKVQMQVDANLDYGAHHRSR
jgi:hypothetical protein